MSLKCECGIKKSSCEECRMPTCSECDWDACNEAGVFCRACYDEQLKKDEAEFGWMRSAAAQHNQACRDMGISPSSSDVEVMAAAQRLK